MARISEEKKNETKKKILDISGHLFLKNGYGNTSVKQIASGAGIAEGTIFNYFNTKADIFLQVVSDNYFKVPDVDFSHYDFAQPVGQIIMGFIDYTLNNILMLPKNVLIELSTALLATATAKKDLAEDFTLIDRAYVKILVGFIIHLKNMGKIADCDCQLLGECIFGAILMELIVYLNIRELTKEEVIEKTHGKISIILKGYAVD